MEASRCAAKKPVGGRRAIAPWGGANPRLDAATGQPRPTAALPATSSSGSSPCCFNDLALGLHSSSHGSAPDWKIWYLPENPVRRLSEISPGLKIANPPENLA
jgi:hypothetical protein